MKDSSITFRLDGETKEQLKQMAATDDVTLSKLVFKIVKNYVEERRNGKSAL